MKKIVILLCMCMESQVLASADETKSLLGSYATCIELQNFVSTLSPEESIIAGMFSGIESDQESALQLLKECPTPFFRANQVKSMPFLIMAFQKRWPDVFMEGFTKGAPWYVKDAGGKQVMHYLAQHEDVGYLVALLVNGVQAGMPTEDPQLSYADNQLQTPLYFAVCAGNVPAVFELARICTAAELCNFKKLIQLARTMSDKVTDAAKKAEYEDCMTILNDQWYKQRFLPCSLL